MGWPHLDHTAARLMAESRSSDIAHRLAVGDALGVRQGETTITDMLVLDLAQVPGIGVQKVEPVQESRDGMDWLLALKISEQWVVIAVQAKRMKFDRAGTPTYPRLNHRVRRTNRTQISLLEEFCRREHVLGAYAFYNMAGPVTDREWHCEETFAPKLMGCSLVPLANVKRAVRRRGRRTFAQIHSGPDAIPLRCLFHQSHQPSGIAGMELGFGSDSLVLRDELPFGIRPVGSSPTGLPEPIRLDPGLFPGAQLPRWIVTAEVA